MGLTETEYAALRNRPPTETKATGNTSVQVSKETKAALDKARRDGETYDDLFARLLAAAKGPRVRVPRESRETAATVQA